MKNDILFEENDFVKYNQKNDEETIISRGKIIKKLTRNLFIVNNLDTNEDYRVNKSNIIEKMRKNNINWLIELICIHLLIILIASYVYLYKVFMLLYFLISKIVA